jgi:hypothetical protein
LRDDDVARKNQTTNEYKFQSGNLHVVDLIKFKNTRFRYGGIRFFKLKNIG